MKKTILSTNQSALLENLIASYGQIVTSEQIFRQAQDYWDYKQTKNQITMLVKNGWLFRIKRGLYAISDLSSRGFLTLSPFLVANLLVSDSYVSFESALSYWGMFDQLTQKTVSISLKMYKQVQLAGMQYRYIRTQPKYFFGWHDVHIGNQIAHIATPEKALIDLINYHRSLHSIDLVVEKITAYKNDLDFGRFNEYITSFPTITIKSFGLLFDLLGIDSELLYSLVKSKHGTHWMLSADRKFNAKWRLYYQDYFDQYKTA